MKKLIAFLLSVLFTTSVIASDRTKVDLDKPKKVKYYKLVIDNDRAVVLRGVVRTDNISKIIRTIKDYDMESSEPIFLIINSPGGYIADGFELINTIKSIESRVYCVIETEAYSMAAILSQYCHKTYIHKYGSMMFHEAGYSVRGSQSKITSIVDFTNRYLDKLHEDLTKQMGITLDEYALMIQNDWWITAEEAAKYGLVDGILNKLLYTAEPPRDEQRFFILKQEDGSIVRNPLKSTVQIEENGHVKD